MNHWQIVTSILFVVYVIDSCFLQERRIKKWSRKYKAEMINEMMKQFKENPDKFPFIFVKETPVVGKGSELRQ